MISATNQFASALFCAALILTVPSDPVSAQTPPKVADLTWLAGDWVGEAKTGETPEEGAARFYWTPPTEGAISYYFSWNIPRTRHVHYYVGIFQDAPEGVVGSGIHYRPDFQTMERAPRRLRLSSMSARSVTFECYENCAPRNVSFTLLAGDRLEERWRERKSGSPDFVVTYRRAQ